MEYTEVPVTFTKLTARKMKKGKPFQLSKTALGGNTHSLMVHPALATRIQKSKTKQKGMRMSLSEAEIGETLKKNGGAIKFAKTEAPQTSLPKKGTGKSIGKAIRRGFQKAGQDIKKGIDTVKSEYKEFRDDPKNAKARKLIQDGAKMAITAGITGATTAAASALGQPVAGVTVAPIASKIADVAVDKIGLGVSPYDIGSRGVLARNYHTFLSPMHPSQKHGDGRYRSVQGQGLYVSPQDASRYS